MVAVDVVTAVLVVVAGAAMAALGWIGLLGVLGRLRVLRCRDCRSLSLVPGDGEPLCHRCATAGEPTRHSHLHLRRHRGVAGSVGGPAAG